MSESTVSHLWREPNDLILVNDFLARHGKFCHALDLNWLRHWRENRDLADLAASWNQLTLSGGDRHGLEPNAILNLTHAETFADSFTRYGSFGKATSFYDAVRAALEAPHPAIHARRGT